MAATGGMGAFSLMGQEGFCQFTPGLHGPCQISCDVLSLLISCIHLSLSCLLPSMHLALILLWGTCLSLHFCGGSRGLGSTGVRDIDLVQS